AAHDLSASRLRERVGETDLIRPGELADFLFDVLEQLRLRARVGRLALFERDEADERLALEIVGFADRGRFRDRRMADEGAFDLGRADAVTRDVEHVVNASDDPVVAVLVLTRAVTGEVNALHLVPVRVEVALIVAP